jgi:hypothetical protein
VALVDILDEMADAIRTALSTADWDFQVEPRRVITPTTPSIDVYRGDPATDPELAGFGADAADIQEGRIINVRLRLSPTDYEGNQEILLELADPESDTSIVQALYDDPTLNGYASDLHLLSESGDNLFVDIDPAKVYIGVVWRFLVIPAHS